MEREELRNLSLNHTWTPEALRDTFAAVMGGVAYPGSRPGFAVVAGLCYPKTKDDLEIHVLAETENLDLGELLRACRGLAKQYRLPGTSPHELFTWVGSGKDTGANRIIGRLNEEAGCNAGWNYLTVQSTPILDMPTPYSYMFTVLSECTEPNQKTLYFHNSKVPQAMNDLPRDQVADTKFGAYPAIEALAFVVERLREWLKYRPEEWAGGNVSPYAKWERFNRGRR